MKENKSYFMSAFQSELKLEITCFVCIKVLLRPPLIEDFSVIFIHK